MVTWPMTSRDPERSSRDPNTFRAHMSWCYLATIANYSIVCSEAVRSAILATAWPLVSCVTDLMRSIFSHKILTFDENIWRTNVWRQTVGTGRLWKNDLWNRWVLSLERKAEGFRDGDSEGWGCDEVTCARSGEPGREWTEWGWRNEWEKKLTAHGWWFCKEEEPKSIVLWLL